jgi:DNA-binding transcriptional regulator YiaG
MNSAELKQARQALGLSQQATADLIGTKLRTWQDWEYGITPVPGPVSALLFLLINCEGAVDLLRGHCRKCLRPMHKFHDCNSR